MPKPVAFRPVTSWDDVPVIMDDIMAARIVGLVPETIRKKIQKGEFPGCKQGRYVRIEKADLIAWVRGKWAPAAT